MKTETQLDRCNAYVLSQLQPRPKQKGQQAMAEPGPAVTISYLAGTGVDAVAAKLAECLQAEEPSHRGTSPRWTVFDRHLLEKVLEEHHLPQSLADFLPEERRSFFREVMDELLGLHPTSWEIVPEITETVLHLANAGHVILVGRGANLITARLRNVFHVHLTGMLENRIDRLRQQKRLTHEEAARQVEKIDRMHDRYAKAHFHASIHEDLRYHMVLNMDRLPCSAAAHLIAEGTRSLCREALYHSAG